MVLVVVVVCALVPLALSDSLVDEDERAVLADATTGGVDDRMAEQMSEMISLLVLAAK